MERNQDKEGNFSILDYKLINSILGINIKIFLTNQKIKNTKENEIYLFKMKNNVERKYKNFTNSITKYVNDKKDLKLEEDTKIFQEKIICFNNISTQKYNKTYNRYIKRDKQFSFIGKVKKIIKIQSVYRSYSLRKKFFRKMKEKLKKNVFLQ